MHHCTSLLLLVTIFLSLNASAQVVEKGKNFIHAGIGIAAYNIEWHEELFNTVEKDQAASIRIPVGYERAFTNRITAGAQVTYAKYLTDTTSNDDNARSTDFALKGNIHMLNKKKVSLYAGLAVGFGTLKIDNTTTLSYKGSGPAIAGNLGLRILPIESLFFEFNLGSQNYNLDGTFSESITGNSIGLELKASGFTLGLSLGGRF